MGNGYDAAGNQTAAGGGTFGYDAENRQASVTLGAPLSGSFSYGYDGDGRRVKKVLYDLSTVYVYNALGQLVAEYRTGPAPLARRLWKEHIYLGSRLIATESTEPAGRKYLVADHLGSVRAMMDGNGALVSRHDYFPFGKEIPPPWSGRSTALGYGVEERSLHRFTGKEVDTETGLDYFGARYFSGRQGRFTSPDPLLNSGRPWQPQSWNRYAYALNNPLKLIDPTGLYEWAASGCASGDRDCEKQYRARQKEFKDALSYLKQARDSHDKKSAEYKRLNAALAAYGKENVNNGVTVGFGALRGQAAGETMPLGDLKSFSVTLDPSKWASGADASKFLASDVGHEGTHVSDLRQVFAGAGTLSDFSLEYRGYETSAFVFQGLFTPSLTANQGTVIGGIASRTLGYGGSIIWNTSWSAADKAAIQSRDVGITNAVRSIYRYPETTPHNPWGN